MASVPIGMAPPSWAAATLISYLTPPVAHAGLYKGLVELKASIERWRGLPPDNEPEHGGLATLIQAQASTLELTAAEPAWTDPAEAVGKLSAAVLELEYTLIPHGLHVVGETPSAEQRVEMLQAVADEAGADADEGGDLADLLGQLHRRRDLTHRQLLHVEQRHRDLLLLGQLAYRSHQVVVRELGAGGLSAWRAFGLRAP